MKRENIIDTWKWVTDFESTFWLDFGEEVLFWRKVNKQNSEPARPTKSFASLPSEEMHTILEKKNTLGENKKNNKLV